MMYREEDLLKLSAKENRHWLDAEDETFSWEEYGVDHLQGNTDIVLCVNSIPCFCRISKRDETDFTLLKVYHASMQKDDPSAYNERCPKCGWGIYAFLAGHCYVDDHELGFLDDAGSEICRNTIFGLYFNRQKAFYEEANKRRYSRYKVNEDYASIEELDKAFIVEHIASERASISRTEELADKNVDAMCFGGRLKRVVQDYLSWVEEKQIDRIGLLRTKEVVAELTFVNDRESYKQDNDYQILSRFVFNNTMSLDDFLAVIKRMTPTEIGNMVKSMYKTGEIDKNGLMSKGRKKRLWQLICSQHSEYSQSQYDTFIKGTQ